MSTEVAAPTVPIYLAGEFVEAGSAAGGARPGHRRPRRHDLAGGSRRARTRHHGRGRGPSPRTRRLASYERRDALAHVATCIDRDADELAELLTRESGKPINDARGEVARGALTFRTAAEEALRINGEWLPLDWAPANRGRQRDRAPLPDRSGGRHQPVQLPAQPGRAQGGAGASPPAAASCSSRRPRTRWSCCAWRGYLAETDLPARRGEHPAHGSAHRRRHGLATIGSSCSASPARPSVGWKMKAEAGKKKVVLELGRQRGGDRRRDRGPRLGRSSASSTASFAYAGQVCISVQRIYVVEAIFDEFERRFADKVRTRADRQTRSIRRPTSDRWSTRRRSRARTNGCSEALGGRRPRADPAASRRPLVPADGARRRAAATRSICGEEVFAPVVNLFGVPDFAAGAGRDQRSAASACSAASSPIDLERTLLAHDELEVGGVIVNDVPDLAHRPHAVRRREGLRPRARGAALVASRT